MSAQLDEHRHAPPSIRAQVICAVALFMGARLVLILSAPDVLAMVDQATWKHADLAADLRSGQLPGVRELADLAWNGFNFHQVAFIPYSLAFALFALPLGSGYVSLHVFAAGFSALGVAGWALLLARHGPRSSAIAFAILSALAPLPIAMMQVRPYSGHTEAQGLATLALALLLVKNGSVLPTTPRQMIACGLVAGMALSLSPLAAPVLACGGLGLVAGLILGVRHDDLLRKLSFGAAGLFAGALPYLIRAVFAPEDMFSMPVVEYDQADPASILRGQAGPTLTATLSNPFHLIVNLSSVTQAHSYEGLIGGDSTPANLVVVATTLICVVSAISTGSPARRTLALVLALGPWATLVMVGVAGPDLCLRYLTGIYPLALAGFAFCFGLALERSDRRLRSLALRSVAAACFIAALCAWGWPGLRDFTSVADPSRWASTVRYAPGPLLSSTGLRAMPPATMWDETTAFLDQRKVAGGWNARGFDLPFLPVDDMSTQGWQPFPTISPVLVAQRARLSGENAEDQIANMGWALAASQSWNQGRFESLLSSVNNPSVLTALQRGAQEGAKVRGKPWSNPNKNTEPSRIERRDGAAPSTEEAVDEVRR